MTLAEYLTDYSDEKTKKAGFEMIEAELKKIPKEKVRHIAEENIEATSKNFTYFFPYGRGPMMSIPHCANGQSEVMAVIFSPGTCWTFPYLWQLSHFLMKSAVSCCIIG